MTRQSDSAIEDGAHTYSSQEPTPGSSAQATGWQAVRTTWTSKERLIDVTAASAPSLVFVATASVWSLRVGVAAALGSGVLVFAARLVRRESLRSAALGLAIVAVCAGGALATGQERGYFLLPAAIPFVVVGVCVITIIARRPLTGLLFNRITGGPPDWFRHRSLRRVHLGATWSAVGINVVNAVVQVTFYSSNQLAVLAAAHIATGPIFATLAAITIVAARRAVNRPDVDSKAAQ